MKTALDEVNSVVGLAGVAGISLISWVRNLIGCYEARKLVRYDELRPVPAWLERGLARPAVQRGLEILKRE